MNLLNFFKAPFQRNQESFEGMSTSQKKKFLSNDLVERMIRVEQRVSASFGAPVHYRSTQYYRSLNDHERKLFERHLKNKSKKLFFFSLLVFTSLFVTVSFTGYAVSDVFRNGPNVLQVIYLLLGLLVLAFIVMNIHGRRHRHKRLDKVHGLIEYSLKRH